MRNIFQSICLAAGLFVASTLSANGQSRIERIEIQSENFENLIGVSATREMMVYLPDGYDESRADYAVLYGFHTFFEDETALFENYNIATLLDAAISEGRLPPVIVITPDFSTPMNHSLFADSPVTGNFLTFALEDMVPAIDARYRTIRDRNARGLFGNHIGAYGAIKIAARRPDLFGAVYGLHPVATTSTPDGMVTFLNWEEYFEGVAKQDLSAHWSYSLFTSFFQAFLPNPNNPPYFVDIPVTLQDGERIGDAALLNKLSESLPLIAEVETYADNLKQLNGFKYDWGR
ncbi:MAG: alpha/beta hydrolase-fold protein, partial [Pseudomonadota bacterium]